LGEGEREGAQRESGTKRKRTDLKVRARVA
jgi:hypothetical protein